ncbi:methyltransferase [Streptomyces sp. H10-C2]|uniref:HemK2/MTQ2 family protein methyltransferase n=1 Tax=unclassified Streptomyces TaxID=2593676 RepID=UPI0024B9862C|nr:MULTISPECIES: HemK2/MTQ2 family protein methyltransferase [unclassified Streptomyces]MDJ0346777.1 methyltransferase [Streptomyces sp. PH10-H1]MDJ0374087.1 methyltransferase [Streptomyces sp. H10-C2]
MTTATALLPDLGDLWRLPGVYAPQADTYLLAQALAQEAVTADTEVLDVGTGSGALALLAARMGARVSATDISWRAVAAARVNAVRSRQRITVRRGDLAAPLRGRSFDLVVSNPPYVPAPGSFLRTRGAARAWDAGVDGRQIVDRVCARAPALLASRGALLMVHSGLCGIEPTLQRLSEAGLRGTVIDRAYVPFGPVLHSRLPWLRAQGLVEPGEDKEELVVIRAERS